MRAKELLMLGSTLLKSVPGTLNNGMGGGCALGMMAAARGNVKMDIECCLGFEWMNDRTAYPCICSPEGHAVAAVITHIFDSHVHGDRTWKLEQLADWLDQYDPTPVEEKAEAESVHSDETLCAV